MKKHSLLLPHACKKAGWVVLVLGVLLVTLYEIAGERFDFSFNDVLSLVGLTPIAVESHSFAGFSADSGLMFTIVLVLLLMGSFLTGFSRCREEDEFTEHLRYRALTVTMFILMGVQLVASLFFWGLDYLVWQSEVVMWAPLFYVVCLHVMLLVERRRDEE